MKMYINHLELNKLDKWSEDIDETLHQAVPIRTRRRILKREENFDSFLDIDEDDWINQVFTRAIDENNLYVKHQLITETSYHAVRTWKQTTKLQAWQSIYLEVENT